MNVTYYLCSFHNSLFRNYLNLFKPENKLKAINVIFHFFERQKPGFFLPVQQCHLAEKQQNSVGADTHPAGLSGSLLSSHLKVTTFLVDGAGAAEVPWEFRPLWSPTCPALIE